MRDDTNVVTELQWYDQRRRFAKARKHGVFFVRSICGTIGSVKIDDASQDTVCDFYTYGRGLTEDEIETLLDMVRLRVEYAK